MTWNPCWGCRNHCGYCYARTIAKRFWKQRYEEEFQYYIKKHPTWAWTGDHLSGLKDFRPTFLEAQFDKKFPQKTQKIFVGSMSEINYWKKEWMQSVLLKIKQYPQHIFQFLTKFPEVYLRYIFPENCWLGTTIVNNNELSNMDFTCGDRIKFINIEPILEKIDARYIEYINTGKFFDVKFQRIDWVIIGSETGYRRGKVTPRKEWIKDIVDCCRDNKILIYLKDSLKEIYPEEIKEFPM